MLPCAHEGGRQRLLQDICSRDWNILLFDHLYDRRKINNIIIIVTLLFYKGWLIMAIDTTLHFCQMFDPSQSSSTHTQVHFSVLCTHERLIDYNYRGVVLKLVFVLNSLFSFCTHTCTHKKVLNHNYRAVVIILVLNPFFFVLVLVLTKKYLTTTTEL